MSRHGDLPPAERYRHGTRARYVTGCRCTPCRASNTAYYHQRQARAKALAAELPAAAATPAPQVWTAPDGSTRVRTYARACPGVSGEPCPLKAHLRKDSKGGCCRACREKLVWNGLVDAAPAREHLLALSAQGVGRRSVEAACDVASSLLEEVARGKKTRIRKKTAERILAVDAGAVADHGLVNAKETWGLIKQLVELGCTRQEIARRLGSTAVTPALQLRRRKVLAVTQARVRRLRASFEREGDLSWFPGERRGDAR